MNDTSQDALIVVDLQRGFDDPRRRRRDRLWHRHRPLLRDHRARGMRPRLPRPLRPRRHKHVPREPLLEETRSRPARPRARSPHRCTASSPRSSTRTKHWTTECTLASRRLSPSRPHECHPPSPRFPDACKPRATDVRRAHVEVDLDFVVVDTRRVCDRPALIKPATMPESTLHPRSHSMPREMHPHGERCHQPLADDGPRPTRPRIRSARADDCRQRVGRTMPTMRPAR